MQDMCILIDWNIPYLEHSPYGRENAVLEKVKIKGKDN
jgi:hypothetical protein